VLLLQRDGSLTVFLLQVPNVLQNMLSRSHSSKLTPSSAEASLLSLVDGELRVSSISNLSVFLKVLPRCKTEPEQTLALVVLRATSTASDAKLARSCAIAFEKGGGLRLARAWVDSAVTWQHNDLLVLLLEVLQTLPLQLTSITEARINEPIVKLRKNAREERVKRAAQDLLKFWRSKFTEKDKPSAAKDKSHDSTSTSKTSPPAASTSPKRGSSSSSSSSASASAAVPAKQGKVLKKRTIKRLERLPFGGGSAVSKSSDLIGNLMQRKSAKDAAAAAEAEKKKAKSAISSVNAGSSSDAKMEESNSTASSGASESSASTAGVDDTLSIPLPTIQSFKAVASSSSSSKERKHIRWADESGSELVKVKLIESWRDLVPYDPRHDDQSFKDAKLREHANERHAMLAQHHKTPPAVAASKSREWTTPAFMRLPEAVAARTQSKTDEMHVQDSRRRHVDEYEVLAGEMPIPSPKEWERVNEPHRGPPLEIPLSDVVESEPSNAPATGPMMAAPTSSAPADYGYNAGGYNQAPGYDQLCFSNRSDYNNGRQEPDADRKLREALGPLQENTVALLLDNPDVVPQVLEEAQRRGNRIPDARVFEIVDHYRRGRFQAPPAYSPYGSQQQPYGEMGSGAGYDHQYQQQYPQGGPGGPFMPGKRKADAMGAPQNGAMPDAPQSFKRPSKKTRGSLPCRFFASPRGCKHGINCHYAHVQPANGPELIGTKPPLYS
jgi:protein phosphatase 1 regulatory subunit 10